MKLKLSKKIKILICLVLLFFIIYEIIHVYALFQSDATGKIAFNEAKWNIEVNGVQVTKDVPVEFKISDLIIDESSHIKPGNLAPRFIYKL